MTTQELLKSKQEQRATALTEVRSFGEKVEAQTWNDSTDAVVSGFAGYVTGLTSYIFFTFLIERTDLLLPLFRVHVSVSTSS